MDYSGGGEGWTRWWWQLWKEEDGGGESWTWWWWRSWKEEDGGIVDFIEFILKSSLWPYKSWCCLGKILISLWHHCCFKSLRVSIVRLLLCGCRTITVPVIKSCRVTIVGLLLCSYRTITGWQILQGHYCEATVVLVQAINCNLPPTSLWSHFELIYCVLLSHHCVEHCWALFPISPRSQLKLT